MGRLADGGSPGRPGRAWLHRTAPEPHKPVHKCKITCVCVDLLCCLWTCYTFHQAAKEVEQCFYRIQVLISQAKSCIAPAAHCFPTQRLSPGSIDLPVFLSRNQMASSDPLTFLISRYSKAPHSSTLGPPPLPACWTAPRREEGPTQFVPA